MTTFTVTQVPGSKRTSHRNYTHAIIGCRDGKVLAASTLAERRKNDQSRWNSKHWYDEKRAADATVGQPYKNHNGFSVIAQEYNVRFGKEFIAKYPTVESYLAKLKQDFDDMIAKLQAEPLGTLEVLQWSMSADNARKALGSWSKSHSHLEVVETAILKS